MESRISQWFRGLKDKLGMSSAPVEGDPPNLKSPTRLFKLPQNTHLRTLYATLTNNGYEILEQNLGDQDFFVSGSSDQATIDVEGSEKSHAWWIRLTWTPHNLESREEFGRGHFILAKLTQALNWKEYWVIEAESPSAQSKQKKAA